MKQEKSRKSEKVRARRKPPLVLRWLRISLRLRSLISRRWAARRVFQLWFTSPRHPEPAREKRWRESALSSHVPHEYGPIATYRWGDGDKRVLMLHGWSGRGPQLGAFVKPLIDLGYQVVTFDAPGHGRTPGKTSSIFRMTEALQAVVTETGSIDAVITHSFGAMVLAYALKNTSFTTGRAVCISSPTTPIFLVNRFCDIMQVDQETRQAFMKYTEQQYAPSIWHSLSADNNVKDSKIPALIIHDQDDLDVPVEYGRQLAEAWPGSRLYLTSGLGHRRILRSKEVIRAVTAFMK